MPDRPWKAHERRAGALIGGQRYPANTGASIDCESACFVAQCKHVARMSLAQMEALALEAERQGTQKQKVGMVIVRRRAGRGRATPMLVILTEGAFRALSGALPGEEQGVQP